MTEEAWGYLAEPAGAPAAPPPTPGRPRRWPTPWTGSRPRPPWTRPSAPCGTGRGGGPLGVLGWSLGGTYALDQATTGTVDAAASYYAALDEEDAARIHCPVLLHLAETDEFDPPEFYDRFVAALRAAGTEVTVHTWPGTGHSFANRDVPRHAPDAAAQAWSITVGFLRDHLARATAG